MIDAIVALDKNATCPPRATSMFFDSSSAGAEQHDRNVALGPGLVLVVFGPLRRHGRPHTLLVFGRSGARPDTEDLVSHLDLHVGLRDQVLVRSGVLRRASLRLPADVALSL